jgi:septum formation protein
MLASGSPRRADLARGEGWNVTIVPPPERAEAGEAPKNDRESLEAFAVRLAVAKAAAVISDCSHGLVLACDTIAEVGGMPLGKPADRNHARRMLMALSGRPHRVVSGVCLWPSIVGGIRQEPITGHAVSELLMSTLTEKFMNDYLDTELWKGKAGACGFQDGLIPLALVSGSPSNVVGLPLELVRTMVASL